MDSQVGRREIINGELNETHHTLLETYNELNEKYKTLREVGLTFDGLNITDLDIKKEGSGGRHHHTLRIRLHPRIF